MIKTTVLIDDIRTFFMRIPQPATDTHESHVIYCACAVEGDLLADANRELALSFPHAEPIDADHFRRATNKEKGQVISTEFAELVMVVMKF